jgi:hypothetical protein
MTTATSTTTAAPPVSVITKDWDWLKTHIVLLAITGALVLGSVWEVENLIAKHDTLEASRYTALLQQANQQTQTVQKQLATDEDHWNTVQAQLLSERQTLENTIEKQNEELAKQQKVDASLTAQEAAERLATQTSAAPGEIVANGDILDIDLPITRSIVSDLDLLGATQANLKTTQTELTNETTLYNNSQAQVAEQKTLVTAQQNQLTTAQKTCDARVKAASKGRFKTFIKGVGVGVGLTITAVLGHLL